MAKKTSTASVKAKMVLGALAGLLSVSALAQETAKVLPKGINRTRGVYIRGKSEERYNASGDREVLAAPLNRAVMVSEMQKQSAQLGQLYNVLNTIEQGLGDSIYQTNLYTEVSVNFQQTIFAHEYGITKKLTFGVIVPYAFIDGKGKFKAESTNSIAQAKARDTQGIVSDAQWAALEANLPNTATMEKSIFTDKGYKPVQDFKARGLGDIEFGGKYNPVNIDDKFLVAFKTGFRAPTTSHVADERNILDQSTGDKQWDYALQGVAEYIPIKQLAFALAVQGTYQIPDTQKNKAVNYRGQSGLPDLTNDSSRDDVKRDLGDILDVEAGVTYGFLSNTILPSVNYLYYYKTADKYSGSKTHLDYEALGANTQSSAHRGEVGLKYSTIPLYAKKKFPLPMEVKGAYQTTFAGKNIADRNFYRFDLILFF